MGNHLKHSAIHSIKWTSVNTAVGGILGPVSLLIKSRFLSPEEFGYLSIILIVIQVFKLFENFGISQAIIQRDSVNRQESSSIFFFNVFFATGLAGIVYLISRPLAVFFELPGLDGYLEIVSIIILVNGPSFLFRAFLEKELHFKPMSLINIGRNVINVSSIFVLLYLDFGVLSVVYAHILSTAFATLAMIISALMLTDAGVSVYFRPSKLYPFLRFGFFISGKHLLNFATNRMDEVVIGYLLSPDVLGIYHFGKQMLEKLRILLTNSFSKVLLPVFSKLKHELGRLSSAYFSISKYIAYLAFPLFLGISMTANEFVIVIFGEQWEESIIVFQVFSITMIFLLLTANVSSSLLNALNRPGLVFKISLTASIIYFVLLALFASNGLIAILITYSVYILILTGLLQYYSVTYTNNQFSGYVSLLIRPGAYSLIMGMGIWGLRSLLLPYQSDVMVLLLSIVSGIVIYVLLMYQFSKEDYYGLLSFIKKSN